MTKNVLFFTLCLLLFGLWGESPLRAQVEQVEIRVDGLACPFCAYGLEKKLKKVEGVSSVTIRVDDGIAILANKANSSIAVGEIQSAVADAGFTPREMSVAVVGTIERVDDTVMLEASNSEAGFLLTKNEMLRKLQTELTDAQKNVRIHGSVQKETPAGHRAHPFTLTITKFERAK